jgi:hypothetical protein
MKAALLLFFVAPLFPATYYLNGTSGSDANSCAAAVAGGASAKKTFASAVGCLSAGSTLIVQSGSYGGAFNGIPNGAAGNFVVIKAETDGGVIFSGTVDFAHTSAYIQTEGLRFESSNQKNILGNHLKFLRSSFKGGCTSGNCVNTVVGSNNFNDTADILFQDCWWYGAGGRYNLLVYNADRVVLRRAVVRHDGGWSDGGSGNPESGINFYDSSDSWCLNCIVVDSNLTYSTWSGAYYSVRNSSVSHATANNGWVGSIALNNKDLGMRQDGAISNATITDFVSVDNPNGGISFGVNPVTSAVTRATILQKNVPSSGDMRGGFGAWGGGSNNISNVIIAGQAGADLYNLSASFFDTFSNGSTSSGTGRQTYNPQSNGLSYITRIEAGSNLKVQGSGGGQMGAQIVNKLGSDGAFRGDPNWNVDTGVSLWPWPNEARIRQEMCGSAGVSRGFCGDTVSLTHYIWNYLGNGCPVCGAATPLPPTNPCDVSGDGVVNSTDFSLAIDQALGKAACTVSLRQNGRCDVVDAVRVGNAAQGQPCRVGQ